MPDESGRVNESEVRRDIVNDSIRAHAYKFGGVKALAEEAGVSRPTMYRYMDLYDEGKEDQIPLSVLLMLQRIDETKDDLEEIYVESPKIGMPAFEYVDDSDKVKRDRIIKHIDDLKRNGTAIDGEIRQLEKKMTALPDDEDMMKSIIGEKISLMRSDLESIDRSIRVEYNKARALERRIAEASQFQGDMRAKVFEDDRGFMVVHDGAWSDEVDYVLELYAAFGSQRHVIGRYRPVEGRLFFRIDDVARNAPLWYEIRSIKRDGGEEISKTGIRALKKTVERGTINIEKP